MLPRWGSVSCLRDIHHDQVVSAWPVTVVGGDTDHVLAAQLAGSIGMAPAGYPADLRRVREQATHQTWSVVECEWLSTNCLHVIQPDQWWGTRLMWAATGEFLCWYVDFRVPVTLSTDGLSADTRDLQLDIVVTENGTWSWKDEDHFRYAIDAGIISREERDAVSASREAVVAEIEARRFPFDQSLLDMPKLAELPALPETWATL